MRLTTRRSTPLLMCAALALCVQAATAADAPAAKAADTSRIVSVGGDVTEIIYALGAADKIIAVDSTSQFPEDALKTKKNVGYLRALSAEGLLSVNPTLIVASQSAGPSDVVKALKATSVPYVAIKDDSSPAGIAEKITEIARVLGAESKGQELASKVQADFSALEKDRKRISKRIRVLFVLAVLNGRATVGGKGSSADAILHLAGAENAAAAIDGFKPVSDEALVEMAPDVVLIMKRSDGTHLGSAQALMSKALAATPAGKANRFIEIDGLSVLGFGPRAPLAARELMQSLYPEFAASQAPASP